MLGWFIYFILFFFLRMVILRTAPGQVNVSLTKADLVFAGGLHIYSTFIPGGLDMSCAPGTPTQGSRKEGRTQQFM